MRIPTSLIVMSIATAVPFGLAIRDTVKGTPHKLTDDEVLAKQLAAEQAQRDIEAAAEAKLAEKQHETLVANLKTIFGPTPASMGTMLASVKFGGEAQYPTWPEGISVDYGVDIHGAVGAVVVYVTPEDQSACDSLRAKLIEAWGTPTDSIWLAPDGSQRARIDNCQLTFDPTLSPAAWLAAIDVIGQPEARLETLPGASTDDLGFHWYVPGTGYGAGNSLATAVVDKGKITYVNAGGETDFDTLVALRDAVSARMKSQPTRDDETGDWVWKKAPTARLHREPDTNEFTLSFGKEPSW